MLEVSVGLHLHRMGELGTHTSLARKGQTSSWCQVHRSPLCILSPKPGKIVENVLQDQKTVSK